MELTQLRYFLAVAESLHMTASAERLHVAQPALSQAIARLEKELEVTLFDRTGRRLALTPCGEFLRERLRAPLATLEEIPREIAEVAQKAQKTVRLNVLAASTLVTDAIIAYHRDHPDVHFSLLQRSDFEECDLSVSTGLTPVTAGEDVFVLEEQIFLAVPSASPYGGRESIRLSEVAEENFISLAGSRQLRGICDKFCMQAGFMPLIGFESDNPASVRGLIAARAGVGFWPEFSFGAFDTEGVRLLPISEPECRRSLILHRHGDKGKDSEAAAFYDFLCRFFAQQRNVRIHERK